MVKKEIDPIRLKRIARNQRNLLICLFLLIINTIYFFLETYLISSGYFDPLVYLIIGSISSIAYFLTAIFAAISCFLLLSNVYNSVIAAVILSLLLFVPCFNIIILFGVSQMATKQLRDNGIRVGFLGASMSQFKI